MQHHKLVSMAQNKLEEVMPVLKGGFSVTFDIFYPEVGLSIHDIYFRFLFSSLLGFIQTTETFL